MVDKCVCMCVWVYIQNVCSLCVHSNGFVLVRGLGVWVGCACFECVMGDDGRILLVRVVVLGLVLSLLCLSLSEREGLLVVSVAVQICWSWIPHDCHPYFRHYYC